MLVVQVGKPWEGLAKGTAHMSRLDPTGQIFGGDGCGRSGRAVGGDRLLRRSRSNCQVLRKGGMKTTEPTASTYAYEG